MELKEVYETKSGLHLATIEIGGKNYSLNEKELWELEILVKTATKLINSNKMLDKTYCGKCRTEIVKQLVVD